MVSFQIQHDIQRKHPIGRHQETQDGKLILGIEGPGQNLDDLPLCLRRDLRMFKFDEGELNCDIVGLQVYEICPDRHVLQLWVLVEPDHCKYACHPPRAIGSQSWMRRKQRLREHVVHLLIESQRCECS